MSAQWSIVHHIDARSTGRGVDEVIAQFGEAQQGHVARWQLEAVGVTRGQTGVRVRQGRLIQVHLGVFAVGHRRRTRKAWWMAGVLACGPNAVLTHRSAAALHGLVDSGISRVEVTVPGRASRRPGILAHSSGIPEDERTVVEGIPVTGPCRTLIDLAAVVPTWRLSRALRELHVQRAPDRLSLAQLLERHRGRRGIARLKALLGDYEPVNRPLRSPLEALFLAFCRSHNLPRPQTSHGIAVPGDFFEVDAAWPDVRVAVELDGRQFHMIGPAFERDRERDRRLQAAGWRVVRVTDRQLSSTPTALATDIRTLLTPKGQSGCT